MCCRWTNKNVLGQRSSAQPHETRLTRARRTTTYDTQLKKQLLLTNRATHLCKCNDVAEPLEIRPFPRAEFVSCSSNGTSIIAEIRRKIWPLHTAFYDHSKIIGTDTDQSSTYDFPLTFHSNQRILKIRILW